MIDVPLENAIAFCVNDFHIDVLFFRNILNVQHRIEWVQLDRLKKNH